VRRITGVVLAGGLGRRMGGVEKGLIELCGRPLLAHVIERLRPQVDELLLNANREIQRYAAFGVPVVGDVIEGCVGPLAGLHAGLVRATHDLVLSVPCDAPSLPGDLASRLLARMETEDAELAIARSRGRMHPVFCLCRRALVEDLAGYLDAGGRAVRTWVESRRLAIEDFDDEPAAFENINTIEDVRRLEAPGGLSGAA
jgi:molybdopterin-guanine dinucleotide biosynthesis protein A